jgi:hypothetical protein
MSNLSVSSLSTTEFNRLKEDTSKIFFAEINNFVQEELVEISLLYSNSINTLQERGYIAINVVQIEDIDENDPDFENLSNGISTKWQYRFVPFRVIKSDPETAKMFEHLYSQDLYNMPIIFVDTRSTTVYKSQIYKTDLTLYISFLVRLTSRAEEVAHENKVRADLATKLRQQPEQKLEDGLYDWLRIKGVDVERQVTTAKHRLDLWIPNKAMLELKQGRVSGDDVCQAIDYAATYQMPIVLVGTGLSSSGSRGIDGFNRAMGKDLIIFVTWGGIRSYLKGMLALN